MPDFISSCAFISKTLGTADYFAEVTGTGRHANIRDEATDGQEVAYQAVAADSAVAGFEEGVGTWNASTNTLARTTITKSSNSDAAVDWAEGDKVVYVTANVQMLRDMGKMVETDTAKVFTNVERLGLAVLGNQVPALQNEVTASTNTLSDLLVSAGLDTGAEPSRYDFDGSSMYLSIPDFTTLGDPAVYRRVEYQATNDLTYVFDDSAPEPIQAFGKVGANYHDGTIWNVSILDSSPIQGVTVATQLGAADTFINLNTRVTLAADFEMRFNWLRQDKVGGSEFYLAYDSVLGDKSIAVRGFESGTPNRLFLQGATNTVQFAIGGLADIANGKQGKIRIKRVGNVFTLHVNDVLKDTVTANTGAISIDRLMGNGTTTNAPAGNSMTDLIIESGADTYWWQMTEEGGETLYNSGTTGSTYNGTWNKPPTRKYIPLNSRFYSLDKAPASVVPDKIAGKTGNIVGYVPTQWKQLTKNPAIWNKPDGEPIFLVLTGQSNGVGHNVAEVGMNTNPRVFDWATDGATTPQVPANADWMEANTSTTARKRDFSGGVDYVGYSGGRIGNTGIAAADRIQRLTGRDVYIVMVAQGSLSITDWTASGGIGESLAAAVAAAVASPELVAHGITEPDAVIWMQGEANWSGMTDAVYLTNWNAWRTSTEGVWTTAGVTPFYLFDFTEIWNWVGNVSKTSGGPKQSIKMPYVAENAAAPVTLVPSQGLPVQPYNYFNAEEIHYSGDGNIEYGAERFALAIAYL